MKGNMAGSSSITVIFTFLKYLTGSNNKRYCQDKTTLVYQTLEPCIQTSTEHPID